MVTRRTHDRRFFLVPRAPGVAARFQYVLAVAAERYGILLHNYFCGSNHYHVLLTDVLGQLPDFTQLLNSLLARATNADLGRADALFDCRPVNWVEQLDVDACIDTSAYIAANPVEFGGVAHGHEWPGARSRPADIGGPGRLIRRPVDFHGPDSVLPEVVLLRLFPPPMVVPDRGERYRHDVEKATAELEYGHRRARQSKGLGFLGREACRQVSPDHRPGDIEERGPGTAPLPVKCRDSRTREDRIEQIREFRSAYAESRGAWEGGRHDVTFPRGTWLVVVRHGARAGARGAVRLRDPSA